MHDGFHFGNWGLLSLWAIRDLKIRRRRRQWERPKSNRLIIVKQQLRTCHHAFFYISLPSLHDYNVKMPSFMFFRGLKQAKSAHHLNFFILLSETTPYQNNFCEKILRFEPKTIFLEFFKNVQICRHFDTPFVLVFSRTMTYFKEHVTSSTRKH